MAKNKGSYRPLVYICSRYAGDVEENTVRTQQFSRFCLEKGNIPLAPQLMFPQFMDDQDPEERGLAISMDMVLMGKCDECWVLLMDAGVSPGMTVEINRAKKRRQPIRWFNDQFEEVEDI